MNTSAARFNGTLKKWNAERGFGFVVADHGDQDIFVHASAFPREGRPPAVGDVLSFELELDREGRKRAVRVRRPGDAEPRPPRPSHTPARTQPRRQPVRSENRSFGSVVVTVLLVVGLGWYGYTRFADKAMAPQSLFMSVPSPASTTAPDVAPPSFHCDGRKHCSQMSSCSEAKRFLQNCPGMEMDGDHDGIPCEQQLCTGLLGG